MPSKQLKAHYEFRVQCGICGRTETETYVNVKSIAALKARTPDWVWRPKQGYSVCPECYARKFSRKKSAESGENND